MKTKEQILAHLKCAGYKKSEIGKIMGFLIGNGTKTPSEVVHYTVGTGTFDDFLAWYQSERDVMSDEEQCPVCNMFRLVFKAMEVAEEHKDLDTLYVLDELLDEMLNTFIDDESDNPNTPRNEK